MREKTEAPTQRHSKLLIIGSGPAGYTAAVYASRSALEPLLIQGLQPGGQLTITTEVENWPGDHSVQGPDLMVRMEEHAKAMGAEVISDYIIALDLSKRPFTARADSDSSENSCQTKDKVRSIPGSTMREATRSPASISMAKAE